MLIHPIDGSPTSFAMPAEVEWMAVGSSNACFFFVVAEFLSSSPNSVSYRGSYFASLSFDILHITNFSSFFFHLSIHLPTPPVFPIHFTFPPRRNVSIFDSIGNFSPM